MQFRPYIFLLTFKEMGSAHLVVYVDDIIILGNELDKKMLLRRILRGYLI